MALGCWWRGDPLPDLPSLPGFSARIATDIQLIARLTGLSSQEIEARFQHGHHAYIAFIEQAPVAYGWVAERMAGVREIQLSFTLTAQNRYLWDFQTFPAWRGRGVYPHFLQTIVRQEMAERFWILYQPGNTAAAHSIEKAGFHFVGELVLSEGRVCAIELFEDGERAVAGANFLNLLVSTKEL
ncbi:MAG TPA: GNAT family N-acetyltransferase [Ktedonobacteraceae bacterium]|nr:GNAT family N-acetyltransferase [Ktedonobacteraceae bacterium]